MKAKVDFVTNSSSCSFTLLSTLTGKVPLIDCCRKFHSKLDGMLESFDRKYSNESHTKFSMEFFQTSEEENEDLSVLAEVEIGLYVSEDQDCKSSKFHLLKVICTTSSSAYNNPIGRNSLNYKCSMKILKQFLEESLIEKEKQFGRLVFLQVPEPVGSGIDGGDPMGHYVFSVDLFKGETFIEEIKIEKGEINKREVKL